MTLHYQDQVRVNELTIDVADPKSGTAEFKATAAKVEPAELAVTGAGGATERVPARVQGGSA